MKIEEMMECDDSHKEPARFSAGDNIEVHIALPTPKWSTPRPSSPLLNILQTHIPSPEDLPVIAVLCDTASAVFRGICADGLWVSTVLARCSPTALPLRGCFDVAIDTGVIDNLLDKPNSRSRALKAVKEVCRVFDQNGSLSSNRTFILLSHKCPDLVVPLLKQGLPGGVRVRVDHVPDASDRRSSTRYIQHVYTCSFASPLIHTSPYLDGSCSELVAFCVAKDEYRVAKLLERGVSTASTAGDLQGTTPCMVAAGVGAEGCLRLLAAKAGPLHVTLAQDLLGQSAIHHAAKAGQTKTLRLLLEYHEGNELPSDREGSTVFQLAEASGNAPSVEMLLEHRRNQSQDACAPPATPGKDAESELLARVPSSDSGMMLDSTPDSQPTSSSNTLEYFNEGVISSQLKRKATTYELESDHFALAKRLCSTVANHVADNGKAAMVALWTYAFLFILL
mmetsp:Transcript_33693/g.73571  ORF Transcript_33693/g.73571 Transcript_33693/m.73571 type:complete len:451 (-) Transcript_33693:264-1616(-)